MKTAIDRLYLEGAYTQPAHGVATVMDSGIVLGNIIAKEARRARRSRAAEVDVAGAALDPGPQRTGRAGGSRSQNATPTSARAAAVRSE